MESYPVSGQRRLWLSLKVRGKHLSQDFIRFSQSRLVMCKAKALFKWALDDWNFRKWTMIEHQVSPSIKKHWPFQRLSIDKGINARYNTNKVGSNFWNILLFTAFKLALYYISMNEINDKRCFMNWFKNPLNQILPLPSPKKYNMITATQTQILWSKIFNEDKV